MYGYETAGNRDFDQRQTANINFQYKGPTSLGGNNKRASNSYGYDFPSQQQNPKVSGGFSDTLSEGTILWKQNVAIVSKKARKSLDVCQDKDAKGMLIIYEDYKMPNQRFDIIKEGNSYLIVARHSGCYLTVGANSDKNGAPIFEDPTPGMVGQRFRMAHLENNEYLIHTFCGKVLDCCEERIENGTRVIQWHCDRKDHQKWMIN